MSIFKNWTDAEVALHNAKLKAPRVVDLTGEPCADESKLHEQIIAECRARGWWFSRSRMDRATTTARGQPDFLIFANGGRAFAIECKTAKGKLTPEQNGTLCWLNGLGHKAMVVRSLAEFLEAITSPSASQSAP